MAALSLKILSGYLSRYYGKKAIILLDEYDTPMQEAYVNGYWANSSSNSLVGKLLHEGSGNIKEAFETLLQGERFVRR